MSTASANPYAFLVGSARSGTTLHDGSSTLSVLAWKERPGARRFSTWHEDPVMTIALWWSQNVRLGREITFTAELETRNRRVPAAWSAEQ